VPIGGTNTHQELLPYRVFENTTPSGASIYRPKVVKEKAQTGIMHFHSSSLLRFREYKSSRMIS
jgi:hypothetical protein